MATLNLTVKTRKPVDLGVTPGTSTLNRGNRQLFRRAFNAVYAQISEGMDFTLGYTSANPGYANAIGLVSSGSGAVGATINGVTVTDTWATSDTVAAGLIAAAINASTNALVQGFVVASNLRMTLTLSSVAAGDYVDVCGTRFIATNGTPANVDTLSAVNTFDMSGNDTADAVALAAAINLSPGLSQYVWAQSVAAVVYVFSRNASWPSGPGVPPNLVVSGASTIVASGAALAASANFGLCACYPGVQGNAITVAASGTGVTILNSATRLTLGTGLGAVSSLGRS